MGFEKSYFQEYQMSLVFIAVATVAVVLFAGLIYAFFRKD